MKIERYTKVEKALSERGIEFEAVAHEPALTTEQADRFIEGIEGVRTKTMFLTNKKKTAWYLLIMDDIKRLDMMRFGEIVGSKRIKMTSPNNLFEKMELPPGVVSPFGLLNNADKDISVYIDREILGAGRMSFHPNTNEKTIFIQTPDLIDFVASLGYDVNVVDL